MTTQTTLQPRRFNVDEYYKMGELGILPEGGCELLDGVVYMKGVGGPWRFSVVEIYTDPAGDEYLTRQVFEVGESVNPSAFPDVSIPVGRIAPA